MESKDRDIFHDESIADWERKGKMPTLCTAKLPFRAYIVHYFSKHNYWLFNCFWGWAILVAKAKDWTANPVVTTFTINIISVTFFLCFLAQAKH